LVLAGPEANALTKRHGHRLFASGNAMQDIHQVLGGDNPTLIEFDGPAHRTMRAGLKEGYSGRTLYPQMEKLVRSQLDMVRAWPRGAPIPPFPHVKRLVSSLLGFMATTQESSEVMDDLIYFFRALVQIHIRKVWPRFMKYLPRYVASRRSVLAIARRIWDEHHMRDHLQRHGDFVALTPVSHSARFRVAAGGGSGSGPGVRLRRMVQTRRAAMEVLRLHPPAVVLSRTTTAAFEFQGYEIPQNEYCIIANTVTHHLPEFFPDPERFDVTRYAPKRKEHLQPNAYCPCGLGPHTCLGGSTADLLYLVITAVLFRHFHVAMQPPDQTLHIVMNPLPAPDDRFRISVTGERHPPPQ